jgi:TatA/E family protein of Tat protein translocase
MMLVFVIVLLLFGGQKLPEFARGLGKTMREFKKAAAGVEDEFKRALEEDERKKNETALTASATTAALTAPKDNPSAVADADPYHDNPGHDPYYDHDHYSEAGPEVQTTPPDKPAPANADLSTSAAAVEPAAQPNPTAATPGSDVKPAPIPSPEVTSPDTEKKQPPASA